MHKFKSSRIIYAFFALFFMVAIAKLQADML